MSRSKGDGGTGGIERKGKGNMSERVERQEGKNGKEKEKTEVVK